MNIRCWTFQGHRSSSSNLPRGLYTCQRIATDSYHCAILSRHKGMSP